MQATGVRPPARVSPPHAYRIRGRFSPQPDLRQPRAWGTQPPPSLRGCARLGPPFRGGTGPAASGGRSSARRRARRRRAPQASTAPGAGGTCHLQRPGGVQGAEGVPGAQAGPLHHVVVRPAEEAVLPQREFIARDELTAAGHAAETLDVVHLGAGAHHEVILAEADAALGALDAV